MLDRGIAFDACDIRFFAFALAIPFALQANVVA